MPDINVTVETSPAPSLSFWSSSLPPQTGNAGKLLGTNGTSASWTNEPTLSSLRIENGAYPYLQLINTGAPTDKKKVRGYVELGGKVEFARVNDAETVGTNLIAWDANNNCGLGTGLPQAKQHVFAGVLSSVAFAVADVARWEINNGNVSSVRLIQLRNSTGGDWTTTTTRLFQATDATAQGFIDFNPHGLNHGLALGTHYAGLPVAGINIVPAGVTNTVGIGTQNAPSKLTVEGDIRLRTNGNALLFTDTGGTTPYMVSAVDGVFYFAGTTAAGAASSVFRCAMRSTNSPLQIDRPLKIGTNGANISGVLKATVTHAIGTIAVGGFLELTSTVTGAIAGAMVHVGGGAPNNLILKGYSANGDTVSVMYHNPSAASVNAGTRSIDLFVTNII